MTLNLIPLMLAADPAAQANPAGMLGSLLIFPLMLGVMYFFLIRPQRKQEKKQKEQRAKLSVGDQVVTIGGLTGRVVNIKDDDITISTSVANTLVTFRREAINSVQKPVSDD
ncbi:MAG: preprotein translocase subunit YajC [Bacillota bacterium]|nr:preprotein translocase subunit YajC [Bacillota bacterium]